VPARGEPSAGGLAARARRGRRKRTSNGWPAGEGGQPAHRSPPLRARAIRGAGPLAHSIRPAGLPCV